MRNRVRAIFRHLKESVDVVAVSNSTDPHIDMSFFYATGLTTGLFEGCSAFLYKGGRTRILTSALEAESAHKAKDPVQVFRKRDHRHEEVPSLHAYWNPAGPDKNTGHRVGPN